MYVHLLHFPSQTRPSTSRSLPESRLLGLASRLCRSWRSCRGLVQQKPCYLCSTYLVLLNSFFCLFRRLGQLAKCLLISVPLRLWSTGEAWNAAEGWEDEYVEVRNRRDVTRKERRNDMILGNGRVWGWYWSAVRNEHVGVNIAIWIAIIESHDEESRHL